ncbi:MAG: DUF3040 domain-containing protein [Microbacteriaceae bacterium]
MGLSEHEQRVLEELERGLYAEDARLATKVASGGNPAGKLVAGALVAVIGLSVMVFAVIIQTMLLGLAAFALMLVGLVVATSGGNRPRAGKAEKKPTPPQPKRSGTYFQDRWDKRNDR